mmetsp:Transcript_86150/g.162370  ORF Transcript_86150/g.162370 Transcript_86150/m.162370 type:complete len:584 (-) Transcript_86150:20-1771(-)
MFRVPCLSHCLFFLLLSHIRCRADSCPNGECPVYEQDADVSDFIQTRVFVENENAFEAQGVSRFSPDELWTIVKRTIFPTGPNHVGRTLKTLWFSLLCVAILVMTMLVVAGMVMAGFTPLAVCRSEPEKAAIACNMFLFLQHLTFTLVIPYTYSLAAAIGAGTVFSGWLIGVYMAGVFAGSTLVWVLFQVQPKLWMRGRALLVLATYLNVVGAVLYFVLSFVAEEASGTDGKSIPGFASLLIFARVVDGLGTGIVVQFSLVSLSYMFSAEERVAWTIDNNFAVLCGLGLGPLLASASVSFCDASAELRTIGTVYVGVAASVFCVCQLHYPESLESIERQTSSSSEHQGSPVPELVLGGSKYTRVVLLCSGLVSNCTRGFAVSGLESAVAFLLEYHYYFDRQFTGVVIGMCFLIFVPLMSICTRLQRTRCMTHMSWTRAFILMAAGSSLLLLTSVADLIGIGRPWCLMLASGIMYPFYVMSDAIVTGVMMKHAFPAGSWLDANHLMLWRSVCLSAIGRNLGPPLSRYSAEFGQDAFATQQLATVAITFLLFEVIFRPCVAAMSEANMDIAFHSPATLTRIGGRP